MQVQMDEQPEMCPGVPTEQGNLEETIEDLGTEQHSGGSRRRRLQLINIDRT